MIPYSLKIDRSTLYLRKSLEKYARSRSFAQFVRRGLNRELIKWWHPVHWLALAKIVHLRRSKALAVASRGFPMAGLVMMSNVKLRKKGEASSALVLGSFDFSPQGVRNLDQFADAIDRSKLSEERGDDFSDYLEEIYWDEDYQEGRRRHVPVEHCGIEGLYFMDVMMRGDDFVDTKDARILMGHPLVIMLGEGIPGATNVEVLPQTLAKRTLPVLRGGKLPKLLTIPNFWTPVQTAAIVLMSVFVLTFLGLLVGGLLSG